MTPNRKPSDANAAAELPSPATAQLLEEALSLGRKVHLEMDEDALVGMFLDSLARLFPHRALAVRVVDPRSPEMARSYVAGGTLRKGVEQERIALKASALAKARLKSAIMKSARLRMSERWDAPFTGVAAGFVVPLVAAGELYGVLDVGYPLGSDMGEMDRPLILPLANHLSVALRNERLHRETTVLRDYQAKLIEYADALILGVDRHWRITVCNQALCKLTGYARHEVVGRDVRDWLSGADQPRLTKLLARALNEGDTSAKGESVEVTLITRAGQVRTVWSVAAISGRGRVEAVVAIGQDQTKLRELQSQVIQAEKLATLGQLAAGVVHELNNPLTSISVYTQYLLDKAGAYTSAGRPIQLSESDVEKIRRIGAGAQRISEFARDLVQYAKPAGDQFETVDINSVARQSLSFCEHLFERSDVTLVEALADDLAPVYAVPGQLEQVMINLITNAAHAVAGQGMVSLRTFSGEPGFVGFAVADNGPGVPQADRERVFEPFFTTKTKGQGTGLGLSIVRNIIDQHAGRITVTDAQGGGAEFTVVLPMGRESRGRRKPT